MESISDLDVELHGMLITGAWLNNPKVLTFWAR